MKKLFAVFVTATLILSGCYNEEKAQAEIKREISEFFELMILEEIDPITDKFVSGTPSYYDFFSQALETFENYSLNYEIKELSFSSSSKEKQVVDVLVYVSGVDENDEKIEYEALYTFTFIPDSSSFKIEELEFSINM